MPDQTIHVSRAGAIGLELNQGDYADFDQSVQAAASLATSITILGGFYNADRLVSICRNVPRKGRAVCTVKIAVGLDSVALVPRVWHELRRVYTDLRQLGFRNVTVAVVAGSSVHFHTKLFYFIKKTRPLWFIGSANPGSERHELMVSHAGRHEALSQYVKAVFAKAIPVDTKRPPQIEISTLKDFFLTGMLIHKPAQQRPYSFDAYRFNSDDRERLMSALAGGAGVEHARPTTSGFAFSLRSAMGLDDVSGESDVQDVQRTQYRPYSADSVFGYWLPAAYASSIAAQTARDQDRKLERLSVFSAALEAPGGIERAKEGFREHVASMQTFLQENEIAAAPVANRDIAFDRFIASRRRMLADPVTRERQSRNITIEYMPDIWEDRRAVEAFERSFFEDVAYRVGLPGNGRGRIVKSLEAAMGDFLPDTAEDLREAFAEHLAASSWTAADWVE